MPSNTFKQEIINKMPFASTLLSSLTASNDKFENFNNLTTRQEERLRQQSVLYRAPRINNIGGLGINQDMQYYDYMYAQLDTNKITRIQDYRRMATHPELSDAIDEICDECIVAEEDDNRVVNFRVHGEYDREVKKELEKEWKRFENYFKLEEKGWEYFRTLLIEGEVFFENIISSNRPDFGILGVMNIPTELVSPIYDNVQNGIIKGYSVKRPIVCDDGNHNKEQLVMLDPNQVTYIHSGYWNADKTIRLPYLENARGPYKKLSLIEDSIIIYRLVRAPERLVFTVDVGTMNQPESEAFMRRMMNDYWSNKNFDLNGKGGLHNTYNPQSMLDALWVPKRNGQKGTEISTLSGGQNLGQLEDLMYFVKKLYKALKVPSNRLDPNDPFKDGTEITREELRFAKFIIRLQRSFAIGMRNSFIAHLKLRGAWENYELSESDIDIKFNTPTSFGVMREQQIFSIKSDNFNSMSSNESIANSFAQRYYLGLSDAQMAENREWRRKDAELDWEIEQIRTSGPDFYDNENVMQQAESDILGGGAGGGGAGTPPPFGPSPQPPTGEGGEAEQEAPEQQSQFSNSPPSQAG